MAMGMPPFLVMFLNGKIQFFFQLMTFFFEICGFLLRGWLGRLTELVGLAGWAEGRKRKEDEKEDGGGGRGEEGGRRRRREEGAGRKRKKGVTTKWPRFACRFLVVQACAL